MYLC